MFLSGKGIVEGKGLHYKLIIIQGLLFALPLLIVTYIFYQSSIFENVSNTLFFVLILLLVLSGLVILRQIFDRFFAMAAFMKKAESGEAVTMGIQKDTAELHDISLSFNNLVEKLQRTTDELSRRVLELFVIKELTEIANQKTEVEELLLAVLNKAMAVTKARIGSVFMVESGGDQLRLVGSRGPGQGLRKDEFIPVKGSLMKYVIREKCNLLVSDIENDPRTLKPNDPKYGGPSFLSMPIFIGDEVAAVINISHKERDAFFNTDDEHILTIMLGEISFAVENSQLRLKIEEYLKDLELHAANLEQEVAERKRIEEMLRQSEKKYMEMSITDGLTGLFNCRHFYSQLGFEIERTARYSRPLSLLLLDIDNFKAFNDTYGHLEGDRVLVRMAEIIQRAVRRTDTVYRYGGEEFVVILPETAGLQGVTIADRIREDFKRERFYPIENQELHVTTSVGVAQFSPGETFSEFVKRADHNMYRAKKMGKDRVFFPPPDEGP